MMKQLKPKEWHEQFLANADKEKIAAHLAKGDENDVTRMAVTLARQCTLFTEFTKLWTLRVSGLDERLSSDRYMQHVYTNRRTLHKELRQKDE
ncbi:hypothetical protein GC175_22685 [bacterium]|nr:hypothetical protein [bacterium]